MGLVLRGRRGDAGGLRSVGCVGLSRLRGSGLFLGVELVTDPDTREPATALARDVVAELRRQGILLSTEGPGDNVLKLKPPLCFTRDDADHLLEALDPLLG